MDINKNNINNNLKNYYKNIDQPIIENYITKFNLKNLLELSTTNELSVFTKKKKNEWKLKDKRSLLKECDIKIKHKIKEFHDQLNLLSKNKSKDVITQIKYKNLNLIDQLENIDSLIETIEKDYPNLDDEPSNFLETFSN
jgi:hypothetical protein